MAEKRILTFSQLYKTDYELTDIYAERQKWHDGVLFVRERPRKSNGLVFLNGCSGKYTDVYGMSFEAPCKSLVCLPYESRYSVLNVSSGTALPDAYLVEFNIVQNDGTLSLGEAPFNIASANPFYVKELCANIVGEYEAFSSSPAILKMNIYKLLAYLGKEGLSGNEGDSEIVAPAIEFIKNNPTGTHSVQQLASMCHMSSASFRRLFLKCTGKSPIRYVIDKKTAMAKKMLENSNTSVERIAELLEFESSSYFCKLFKKKTGMTPTEYRNNN